jgi:hypothetical protein
LGVVVIIGLSSVDRSFDSIAAAISVSLFNVPPSSRADTTNEGVDNIFLSGAPGSVKDRIYYIKLIRI